MHADPKVAKDIDNLTQFFELLGFVCIKAAHKHVDDIDPRQQRLE